MISPESLKLASLLGPRIDAVVGVECNLYFEALSLRTLTEDWELTVTCTMGRQLSDRWTLRAEADHAGIYPFAISYRDPGTGERVSASCDLHVHATISPGRTYAWLPIGDSITAAGGYVRALACSGFGLPLGTRVLAPEGPRHEGYPGWRYIDFFQGRPSAGANFVESATSPFLFPSDEGQRFDFGQYLQSNHADREPDIITIFLGTNDIALLNEETLEAGIANALKYAEALVDSILAATSHAIVGIVPPLTPGRQDAFGLNYGCLIPRWRYRKNQHALAHAIRERFAARHERLDIVPAYLRIDPVSGYPERMEQVNGRAEGMKLTACNAVHPSESGHRQIADALLSWAAGRLS